MCVPTPHPSLEDIARVLGFLPGWDHTRRTRLQPRGEDPAQDGKGRCELPIAGGSSCKGLLLLHLLHVGCCNQGPRADVRTFRRYGHINVFLETLDQGKDCRSGRFRCGFVPPDAGACCCRCSFSPRLNPARGAVLMLSTLTWEQTALLGRCSRFSVLK